MFARFSRACVERALSSSCDWLRAQRARVWFNESSPFGVVLQKLLKKRHLQFIFFMLLGSLIETTWAWSNGTSSKTYWKRDFT